MKNNIIFAGCSFTWGQGLWSYLETKDHVPSYEEWIFEDKPLPSGSHEIREKLRFANIVAEKLNSNSIVKYNNGGCEDESIRFINYLFDVDATYETYFPVEKYSYDDISTVVYQTSQLNRNVFMFEHNNEFFCIKATPDKRAFDYIEKRIFKEDGTINIIKLKGFDPLYEWMYENDYEIEDVVNQFTKSIIDNIENTLSVLCKNGVNVKIVSWTNEYLEEFNKRNFFKDKLIKLEYEGQVFYCIEDLYKEYPNMRLDNDNSVLHYTGNDEHPSKLCHEVIANSILKSLNYE